MGKPLLWFLGTMAYGMLFVVVCLLLALIISVAFYYWHISLVLLILFLLGSMVRGAISNCKADPDPALSRQKNDRT